MQTRPIPVVTDHELEDGIPRVPTNTPEDSSDATKLQSGNTNASESSNTENPDNDEVIDLLAYLDICERQGYEEDDESSWTVEESADHEVIEIEPYVIDQNAVADIVLQIRASEGEMTLNDLLSYRGPISQATRQEVERQLAQNAPANHDHQAVDVNRAALPSPNLARAIGRLFAGVELNASHGSTSNEVEEKARDSQSDFTKKHQ